jgi:hypothetical protein
VRFTIRIIEKRILSAGEKPFIWVPRVRDTWSNIKVDGAVVINVKRVGAIQYEADSKIV